MNENFYIQFIEQLKSKLLELEKKMKEEKEEFF